jgi:hypothetical protein
VTDDELEAVTGGKAALPDQWANREVGPVGLAVRGFFQRRNEAVVTKFQTADAAPAGCPGGVCRR